MVSAIMMLLSCPLLMLRITGNTGSFPRPLKAAEEAEYVRRSAEGDMAARNTLVEHNLRLVAHIVKKYYSQSCDQDDLISIGTIGLIKGVSTYRPDKGVRLATYASRCIENEILMHFRAQKKTAGEVSLSDSIEPDGEGNALSLMDVICDDGDMLEELAAGETVQRLRGYVQRLEPREQLVITKRFGIGGVPVRTQREIADECRISRSYVSRIEKKALEKLKVWFEEDEA